VLLKKVVVEIIIGDVIERDSVDGVGAGIVVEVSVIGVVEEGSAARVRVSIIGNEVGVVEKESSAAEIRVDIIGNEVGIVEERGGVKRACTIERGVAVGTWCFGDKFSFKNESNKKSKFILDSSFSFFSLLSLLSLFSL
jgi:hypothetical protein